MSIKNLFQNQPSTTNLSRPIRLVPIPRSPEVTAGGSWNTPDREIERSTTVMQGICNMAGWIFHFVPSNGARRMGLGTRRTEITAFNGGRSEGKRCFRSFGSMRTVHVNNLFPRSWFTWATDTRHVYLPATRNTLVYFLLFFLSFLSFLFFFFFRCGFIFSTEGKKPYRRREREHTGGWFRAIIHHDNDARSTVSCKFSWSWLTSTVSNDERPTPPFRRAASNVAFAVAKPTWKEENGEIRAGGKAVRGKRNVVARILEVWIMKLGPEGYLYIIYIY